MRTAAVRGGRTDRRPPPAPQRADPVGPSGSVGTSRGTVTSRISPSPDWSVVFNAISQRDYAWCRGSLILALNFVVVNLAVDVIYTAIDPRISYAAEN